MQYQLFDEDHIYDGSFTPNIMFNFKTGSGHLAAGKVLFDAEGNCTLNNLYIKGTIQETYKIVTDDLNITPDYNNYIFTSAPSSNVYISGSEIFSKDANNPVKFTIINMSDAVINFSTWNWEGENINLPCSYLKLAAGRKLEILAVPTGINQDGSSIILNINDFYSRKTTSGEIGTIGVTDTYVSKEMETKS